ncbi:galactose/glucose ABC transporter substrate-binding protein MglB [Candidatus Haliotispira prima]|uniref:D-galactose/methyl-galactoside binding periplasmic protein MglB n=1 Tax=Candidatus Haliotispira prima TaxID=3034016 RepID=A0ABY8MKI5_9SPIO|nr:galactose/glucose ABC transporter substrate-binding protein MglB [Candidatus Haliotispira prima]
MKKSYFSLFVAVILAVGAVSLSARGSSSGGVSIGATIYNFGDNFMNGVVAPALKKHAKENKASLTIVDSENQQAKQNDQVDIFINKGVQVLAVNLVDPASARTVIEKAKAADTPLILYNKEPTEAGVMDIYDKVWYVGTNSAESGILQGEMIAADWKANAGWDKNGDGVMQYVMLKGEPGHPDAEARTKEAILSIKGKGIKVQELALQADPTWSTQFGNDTMAAWLTSGFGEEIEVVIANNDGMAFGAITAMESAGVSLPIYGVDALEQALQLIKEGKMNGTVLNDGKGQAHAVIDLAMNVAAGKAPTAGTDWKLETDGSKAIRVPYVAVTE